MNSLQKLKVRISILLWIAFAVLACFTFFSCAITGKAGGKEEATANSSSEETSITQKNSKDFGFKKYIESEYETVYEPIDPTKPTSRKVDENGNTTTTNLKETKRKKNTKGEETNQSEAEENTNTKKNEEAEANSTQSWYKKITARVPWYVFFFGFLVIIGGLFLFLGFLIIAFVVWKMYKKMNLATTTLNQLKDKVL